MVTKMVLLPTGAEFPETNYANLTSFNDRPAIEFDPAINQSVQWSFVAPSDLSGGLTAKIFYTMASAVSGDIDIDVSIEAVTDGDTVDLDSSASFDAVNSADNNTVPGTAGYVGVISVTLTNADGVAAGDYVRLRVTRDAVSDTAAGNMRLIAVELQDSA